MIYLIKQIPFRNRSKSSFSILNKFHHCFSYESFTGCLRSCFFSSNHALCYGNYFNFRSNSAISTTKFRFPCSCQTNIQFIILLKIRVTLLLLGWDRIRPAMRNDISRICHCILNTPN